MKFSTGKVYTEEAKAKNKKSLMTYGLILTNSKLNAK